MTIHQLSDFTLFLFFYFSFSPFTLSLFLSHSLSLSLFPKGKVIINIQKIFVHLSLLIAMSFNEASASCDTLPAYSCSRFPINIYPFLNWIIVYHYCLDSKCWKWRGRVRSYRIINIFPSISNYNNIIPNMIPISMSPNFFQETKNALP